jgi:hypothetical protein
MKRLVIPVFLAVALTLSCSAVFAHHGFGVAFDMANPLTQKGTVTSIQWTNPHVQLFYDVKDASGKTVNWAAEMTNPRALVRMGFTQTTLKPGDNITITTNAAKSGAPRGLIVRVLLADKLVYNDKKPVDDLLQDK